MSYYPGQSVVIGMTIIRRERKLPRHAVGSKVNVRQSQPVQADTVVLEGSLAGDFVLVDVLKPLGLKNADGLNEEMLLVRPGESVAAGQPLLSLGSGRRAKEVNAPADAVFVRWDGAQMILRKNPVELSVRALLPGTISAVRGTNVVVVESTGALIQGAWGNGKEAFATLTLEPDEGLEALAARDDPMQRVARTAMILAKPIRDVAVFHLAEKLELGALIASSMSSELRDAAFRLNIPVLLTEGFGEQPMSEIVYNLLRGNANRPGAVDAKAPDRWTPERPEIAIPLGTSAKPPAPEANQPLLEGALVRVVRGPHAGQTGRVRRLVAVPRAVENGLRYPGAEVQFGDERQVFVPQANLELLGRPVDATGRA